MTDITEVQIQMQLLKVAEGLIRYRFELARLILELESGAEEEDQAEDSVQPEKELRSDLECALADHFDPLLKMILEAVGEPRGLLLETALDLVGLRHRLRCFCETLPRSPLEDAMLDGDIPADVPTEMRTTINAIIEDQLDLAFENLMHAAGYHPPEPIA
jgi:hypothetical protein